MLAAQEAAEHSCDGAILMLDGRSPKARHNIHILRMGRCTLRRAIIAYCPVLRGSICWRTHGV